MREPDWLTMQQVLLFHKRTLDRYGGPPGVRDEGLLESALARPRNLYSFHPDASLFELAAAYGFGIVRNHPFVDGNKRSGTLVIRAFLSKNGYQFKPPKTLLAETIEQLAAGSLTEEALATRIESWSTTE